MLAWAVGTGRVGLEVEDRAFRPGGSLTRPDGCGTPVVLATTTVWTVVVVFAGVLGREGTKDATVGCKALCFTGGSTEEPLEDDLAIMSPLTLFVVFTSMRSANNSVLLFPPSLSFLPDAGLGAPLRSRLPRSLTGVARDFAAALLVDADAEAGRGEASGD